MMPTPDDITSHCPFLTANKRARLMNKLFNTALKPLGLTGIQFSICACLYVPNHTTPKKTTQIAEELAMDRTTLSRDMGLMVARGLVELASKPGDKRQKLYILSAKGLETFDACLPIWERTKSCSWIIS